MARRTWEQYERYLLQQWPLTRREVRSSSRGAAHQSQGEDQDTGRPQHEATIGPGSCEMADPGG